VRFVERRQMRANASQLAVVVASFLAVLACSHPAPPSNFPADSSACQRAGQRLRELGCPGAVSPKGHTFEAVCVGVVDSGVDLTAAGCVERAGSCDAVKACAR
jgi:hypothetical protein